MKFKPVQFRLTCIEMIFIAKNVIEKIDEGNICPICERFLTYVSPT